jgi:hypothetical protein
MRKILSVIALVIAGTAFTFVRARAAEAPAKAGEMKCCVMDPKAAATLDRIKKLEGTWTMNGRAPGPMMSIVFKPTAGGSAVIETMFPGTDEEMINLYTADGDKIVVTHYCKLGQQPRMKQADGSDEKTIKFEFVEGGNIESRDEGHMDAVALSVDGDKLTETWTFYANGKVVDQKAFEFTRQPAQRAAK